MSNSDSYYREILVELDNFVCELTDWEADFLESVFKQGTWTDKQKAVIDTMKEKYLG